MKISQAVVCSLLWVVSITSSNADEASNVVENKSSLSLRGTEHDKDRKLFLFDIFKIFPTYPSPWYPSPPTAPWFQPYPSPPLFNPYVPPPPPPPAPPPVQPLVCATVPTDRYYNLIAKHSNMALNVEGEFTNNGASLIQWPVTSTSNNDNFRFESLGDGYYQIIAQHSQKGVNGKHFIWAILKTTLFYINLTSKVCK